MGQRNEQLYTLGHLVCRLILAGDLFEIIINI